MEIPNISDICTDRISLSGKGFKTIRYEDGKDCYVRIPEYVCEDGIEIQHFNGVPKAYMALKSDPADSHTFANINKWLRQVGETHFPNATVHPLGSNGYLKVKIDFFEDALDVVIFDKDKQQSDHSIIEKNCRVSSICMLKGVWCMNDTVGISLRAMQMRIFPSVTKSLNTDECLITEDEEDMAYVPFESLD